MIWKHVAVFCGHVSAVSRSCFGGVWFVFSWYPAHVLEVSGAFISIFAWSWAALF